MAAPQHPEAFIRWFREVAPYVHDFGGRTFVVAFGGEMMSDRARLTSFIHDINLLAALEIRLVLVHGARPQIEAELKARGVRSKYAQGLRVTDERALQAVKGAAGVLRFELEALLSQGLPDSPMARAQIRVASGNYITARPIGVRKGIDFQFTGAVRKIDASAIDSHLDSGDIVLVPHLGYSPTGEVFNLAWEDVAETVAVALKADKLIMYTDRLPTDRKGEVISELTAEDAATLSGKKSDLTPAAMRALEHAARAVQSGVGRGHIVTRRAAGSVLLELFTHAGVGTMISAGTLETLRPARIEDVRGLLSLIEPLEAEGTLVKRSRELLEAEIGNFFVVEHDGAIAGCAALYPLEDRSGEFACLAVAPKYRDAGYGERLLKACEERAKKLRLKRLFALTTHTAHWFLEQGFRASEPSALPSRRQALYNWKRNSKVFLKRL
jgi:amino-acid N-acetyltransferase